MRTKRLSFEASIMTVLLVVLPAITAMGQGASGRAPQGGSGRGGTSKPTGPSDNRKSKSRKKSSDVRSLQQTLSLLKEALSIGGNFTYRHTNSLSPNSDKIYVSKTFTPISFDQCTIEFRASDKLEERGRGNVTGSTNVVKLNIGVVKPNSISIEHYENDKNFVRVSFVTSRNGVKRTLEQSDYNRSAVGVEDTPDGWAFDVSDDHSANKVADYLKRLAILCRGK